VKSLVEAAMFLLILEAAVAAPTPDHLKAGTMPLATTAAMTGTISNLFTYCFFRFALYIDGAQADGLSYKVG
jgi:hypothetical protein